LRVVKIAVTTLKQGKLSAFHTHDCDEVSFLFVALS
jgi:hypothetical protein